MNRRATLGCARRTGDRVLGGRFDLGGATLRFANAEACKWVAMVCPSDHDQIGRDTNGDGHAKIPGVAVFRNVNIRVVAFRLRV